MAVASVQNFFAPIAIVCSCTPSPPTASTSSSGSCSSSCSSVSFIPASSSASASSSSSIPHEPSIVADSHQHRHQQPQFSRGLVSRGLASLLAGLALEGLTPNPSSAFSISISGPKDWLKGQKKKTADYLLAPIIASRERLKSAFSLTESMTLDNLSEAHKLMKVAARDCIKPEDGSLVAFQVKTGVEVCTFRLILKNAASLLDDSDPAKLKANVALDNLVSSFTSLDGILENASDGNAKEREVVDAFNQTNSALDRFEGGVRGCLGIS